MTEDNRSAYGRLAALVYDFDKPVGHSFGDIEFYLKRLEAAGAREVLEPAVGNGRVLIPLAKAGFAMTGFDNSPDMFAYLKRNCGDHRISANLRVADFENFAFNRRYDAIVMPAGSFQLIYEIESVVRFLRRCRSHLNEGGKLMFDLDAESEFLSQKPEVRTWKMTDGSQINLTQSVNHHDRTRQQVEFAHRYEHSLNRQVIASQAETFRLRWWRPDQIVQVLATCGFNNVIPSGAYQWRRAPRAGESVTLEADAR